jgi:hypothetical protein
LAADNAFDKNNFPDDLRFIDEAVPDGYIRFTSTTGNKYHIDLSSLKISREKEETKEPEDPFAKRLRLLNKSNETYGYRNDSLQGKMYILAKDSTGAMKTYPGNSTNEAVYKRLCLFTAKYTISNFGNHKIYHYTNLEKLSGADYLNPVFLKDFTTGATVHLQKPGAYIVLHNDSLTNNAKSIITAIDDSNRAIWQLNTGISTKLAYCMVKGKYCILIGNKHSILSAHFGSDMLCIVNMESGKIVSPTIKE